MGVTTIAVWVLRKGWPVLVVGGLLLGGKCYSDGRYAAGHREGRLSVHADQLQRALADLGRQYVVLARASADTLATYRQQLDQYDRVTAPFRVTPRPGSAGPVLAPPPVGDSVGAPTVVRIIASADSAIEACEATGRTCEREKANLVAQRDSALAQASVAESSRVVRRGGITAAGVLVGAGAAAAVLCLLGGGC